MGMIGRRRLRWGRLREKWIDLFYDYRIRGKLTMKMNEIGISNNL